MTLSWLTMRLLLLLLESNRNNVINYNFKVIMGSSPKTKADCDYKIADLQGQIAYQKARIASMPNGKAGSAEACNKGLARHQLANLQAELAKLKALRKTLK